MKKVAKIMQIVLKKEVPNLGQEGDTIDVKAGFARNFLLPQNLAVPLGSSEAKALVTQFALKKQEISKMKTANVDSIKNLAGKKLIFTLKVNKAGRPFGAIHAKDVAQKLKIDESLVQIAAQKPLKKLGLHEVILKYQDQTVKIVVEIKSEK